MRQNEFPTASAMNNRSRSTLAAVSLNDLLSQLDFKMTMAAAAGEFETLLEHIPLHLVDPLLSFLLSKDYDAKLTLRSPWTATILVKW